MNQAPLDILRQYWRYDTFRPLQHEIIASVLAGSDTVALLPTGAGKSLCFQLPALVKPGICLVISPLIALMKDQVDQLRKKNITAFALTSGMNRKELINMMKVAADSNCKFLYVSPERLGTAVFMEYLPVLTINLIAVDEAHCVSQWGYDFRPAYLRIAALRRELPDTPMLALTASATPDVLEDICNKLELRDPARFRLPFTRPNLSYSVFSVISAGDKIAEILQRVAGSSIVYCQSRKATATISAQLERHGLSAAPYHAGLLQEERRKRQEDWIKDRLRVMVCTTAFGMGIDKPGVRTVIHAGIPDSLENYYQEAGRAGRDGNRAYAVLLFEQNSLAALRALPDIRFPHQDTVRRIFQGMMNYLQLPAGSGEGNYYDFDATRFIDAFGLDAQEVWSSIKVLEQEGLMSYQQQVFLPSRVQWLTDRKALQEFEQLQPDLRALIHALLRNYPGIFEDQVPVYEKRLAFALHRDQPWIVAGLQQLHAWRMIMYTPRKDTPQLYFFRDRPNAEDLYIDPVGYRDRKERYAARILAMESYLEMKSGCRSRRLANYFGDETAADCGICDRCLEARKNSC
ncbi:MAG: ATP-dependent DNA helicase RecQ [Bacteroidota bacterium]|nr:ATP-dependent DNA helicase RecQ [Bacteroidota bacterium]MDP4215405.1 ATP-dependent DNA helicase RecQ [Bacteroidota bacterium]MDP4256752.1 ATP-dependent DNA helicase RecQ [Bacteroidota bacterium]